MENDKSKGVDGMDKFDPKSFISLLDMILVHRCMEWEKLDFKK